MYWDEYLFVHGYGSVHVYIFVSVGVAVEVVTGARVEALDPSMALFHYILSFL